MQTISLVRGYALDAPPAWARTPRLIQKEGGIRDGIGDFFVR
jgi:hypothetical protein